MLVGFFTCEHEADAGRAQDGGNHGEYLVEDEGLGDGFVLLGREFAGAQQVDGVGHGGGAPAPPLVVELLEVLRGVGVGVRCCAVLHPPALLQQ